METTPEPTSETVTVLRTETVTYWAELPVAELAKKLGWSLEAVRLVARTPSLMDRLDRTATDTLYRLSEVHGKAKDVTFRLDLSPEAATEAARGYLLSVALTPGSTTTPEELLAVFTPEAIRDNAHRIYDFMQDHRVDPDTVNREAMFDYSSTALGMDYGDLFKAWLDGVAIRSN